MTDEKSGKLGITNPQEPSNTDPTHDTTSQPNPLKRVVTVGRNPESKNVSVADGGNSRG